MPQRHIVVATSSTSGRGRERTDQPAFPSSFYAAGMRLSLIEVQPRTLPAPPPTPPRPAPPTSPRPLPPCPQSTVCDRVLVVLIGDETIGIINVFGFLAGLVYSIVYLTAACRDAARENVHRVASRLFLGTLVVIA